MSDPFQTKSMTSSSAPALEAESAPAKALPATMTPGAEVSPSVHQGQILVPKKSRRGAVLFVVLLAALGIGGYEGYTYLVEGQFMVATDDAYVKSDMAVIAAKVSGYVASVSVPNNVLVKTGDVLVTIDDGDYKIALQAAQDKLATQDATMERMAKQTAAQASVIEQAVAQLTSAKVDAERASLTYGRAESLLQSGAGTRATLDNAKADRDRANAVIVGAQASIASAQAAVDVLKAQQNEASAVRKELVNAVDKAERDLSFTIVRAPFDGVVGNRVAQPGLLVQPGSRLMAVVPLDGVYIEANFKETQLGRLKPGQKVNIEVDALANRKIVGVVQGVAPASGAEFSLLPPENATGNFTKIVQRVPVRINVPAEVAREGVLRQGLSVWTQIDTRDEAQAKPSLLSALGLDDIFGTAHAKRAP